MALYLHSLEPRGSIGKSMREFDLLHLYFRLSPQGIWKIKREALDTWGIFLGKNQETCGVACLDKNTNRSLPVRALSNLCLCLQSMHTKIDSLLLWKSPSEWETRVCLFSFALYDSDMTQRERLWNQILYLNFTKGILWGCGKERSSGFWTWLNLTRGSQVCPHNRTQGPLSFAAACTLMWEWCSQSEGIAGPSPWFLWVLTGVSLCYIVDSPVSFLFKSGSFFF